MSHTKFSITNGLLNAALTVILFVVLPGLMIGTLQQLAPDLSLGNVTTLTVSATVILVTVVAFCRGAFPKHTVIWALSGIGWSLFSAAYLYFLLLTPASYRISTGTQIATVIFDIGLFGLLIAIVMALNSLGNLIELFEARRKITEKQRLQITEIAA